MASVSLAACTEGATVAGHLATFYRRRPDLNITPSCRPVQNCPHLRGARHSSRNWPTPKSIRPSSTSCPPTRSEHLILFFTIRGLFSFGRVVCDVMGAFSWDRFALIYQTSEDGGCRWFQSDLERVAAARADCVISYKSEVDDTVDVVSIS